MFHHTLDAKILDETSAALALGLVDARDGVSEARLSAAQKRKRGSAEARATG